MKPTIPTALSLCLLALSPLAHAADWLPSTEQATTGFGDASSQPRYATIRKTLREADSLLRRNAALASVPQARLRNARFVGVPMEKGLPLTGRVSAFVFPPRAWDGPRGLKPYAMRINGGYLTILFNDIREIFESGKVLEDEALTAWKEPPVTGAVGGRPIYDGEKVVLTRGGVPAWIPVTVGEYLAYRQRELARYRRQGERAAADAAGAQIDEARVRQSYAALKKIDPKAAEEFLATMAQTRKQLAAGKEEAKREQVRQKRQLEDREAQLARYSAALSPAQRAAPAVLGSDDFGLARPDEAARGPRLVRFNKALWTGVQGESAIRLIVVRCFANDRAAYAAALARALEGVDFSALEAMLSR